MLTPEELDITIDELDNITEFLLSDQTTQDSNVNQYDLPKFKKAKNAINNNITSGKIKRPAKCSKCNSTDRIEAHHKKGYKEENNFDIEWLCRACHLKAHVKLNAKKKKDSVTRYDVFDITEANMTEPFRETPEGYLRGRAIITNTGIFNYKQKDGTILRELRTPEDVGDSASLNSFRNILITSKHPNPIDNPQGVNKENAKELQVGFTGADIQFDGHAVSIDMTITDGKTIDEIKLYGKVALSCGYNADLEMKSGFAFGNNQYDAIQKNIRANHIACNIDRARAGDLAKMKLRMDSTDAIRIDDNKNINKENKMAKVKINDVEFEADIRVAEEFNILKKDNEDLKVKIKDKDVKFSELQANSDSSKEKLEMAGKEIEKLKAENLDETKIQDAVKNRIALVDVAVKQEIKIEETMNDSDIKKAVILKVFPEAKLDEKDENYINVRYDCAIEDLAKKIVIDNKKKTLDIKPDKKKEDNLSLEEKQRIEISNIWKLDAEQYEKYKAGKTTDEIKSILGGK